MDGYAALPNDDLWLSLETPRFKYESAQGVWATSHGRNRESSQHKRGLSVIPLSLLLAQVNI
jgi:hypothetical protein